MVGQQLSSSLSTQGPRFARTRRGGVEEVASMHARNSCLHFSTLERRMWNEPAVQGSWGDNPPSGKSQGEATAGRSI
eukprot:366117-Chlamydomonas_euryale.AAC.4